MASNVSNSLPIFRQCQENMERYHWILGVLVSCAPILAGDPSDHDMGTLCLDKRCWCFSIWSRTGNQGQLVRCPYLSTRHGKRLHNYGKSRCYSWVVVNYFDKWPFSIAMSTFTRPGIIYPGPIIFVAKKRWEALMLARICSSVDLLHRRGSFRASLVLQQRVLNHPHIRVPQLRSAVHLFTHRIHVCYIW